MILKRNINKPDPLNKVTGDSKNQYNMDNNNSNISPYKKVKNIVSNSNNNNISNSGYIRSKNSFLTPTITNASRKYSESDMPQYQQVQNNISYNSSNNIIKNDSSYFQTNNIRKSFEANRAFFQEQLKQSEKQLSKNSLNSTNLQLQKGRKIIRPENDNSQMLTKKHHKILSSSDMDSIQTNNMFSQQNNNNNARMSLFCIPTEIYDQYPYSNNKNISQQQQQPNSTYYTTTEQQQQMTTQSQKNLKGLIGSGKNLKEQTFNSTSTGNIFKTKSSNLIQDEQDKQQLKTINSPFQRTGKLKPSLLLEKKYADNFQNQTIKIQHQQKNQQKVSFSPQKQRTNGRHPTEKRKTFTSFKNIYEQDWQQQDDHGFINAQKLPNLHSQQQSQNNNNVRKSSNNINNFDSSRFSQFSNFSGQSSQQVQMNNKLNFNQNQSHKFEVYMQNEQNNLNEGVVVDYFDNDKKIEQCENKIRVIPQKEEPIFKPSLKESLKEVNVEEMSQKPGANKTFLNVNFYWTSIRDLFNWKAETREGSTLIQSGQYLLYYGGMGKKLYSDLCCYDFIKLRWKKIPSQQKLYQEQQKQEGQQQQLNQLQTQQQQIKQKFDEDARCGLVAVPYLDKIIYFGGQKEYNPHLKMRQCHLDFLTYDPSSNEWSTLELAKYGNPVQARRNHCAQMIIDKFLFYFGGIDSNGNYLNDLSAIHMDTRKNIEVQVESKKGENQGIAFFSMAAVFKGELKMDDYYQPYECKKEKNKIPFKKLKEEGIFIFGGKNKKGKANNHLKVIKLGTKPLKMETLQCSGKYPEARYGHTMHYYQNLNSLIVYGGQNDTHKDMYFNSLHLLDLESLQWINVKQNGFECPGKSMHSSVIIDTKMFVFGGIGLQGFASQDMFVLELDQGKTKKMIQRDNSKIQIESYRTPDQIIDNEFYTINLDHKARHQMKIAAQQSDLPLYYLKQLDAFDEEMNKKYKSFQPVRQSFKGLSKDIKQFLGFSEQHNSIVLKDTPQSKLNSIQNKNSKALINQFLSGLKKNNQVTIMSAQEFDEKTKQQQKEEE